MAKDKIAPVTNPGVDIADELRFLIGETGLLEDLMGAFRIKIYRRAPNARR